MPLTYAYICTRSAEACGLKDFNSESFEGDDLRKTFLSLQDAVRSLNADPDITFGTTTATKYVSGSTLTFMPYTEAEQAIIDGGGTVDITDRIVDFRPVLCPNLFISDDKLAIVEPNDLPRYSDRCYCAWESDWDRDVIRFGNDVNDTVTIKCRQPVPVPTRVTDTVRFPERYHEYLILKLAVSLATKLGAIETLAALKDSLREEFDRITSSNTHSRPVYMQTDMARFQR